MTHEERNAVDPTVYQHATAACTHETYAPCDACLRAASTTELTFQSSAQERYTTDLLDRAEAALAGVPGVTVVYREGGCGDLVSPTGCDNHFGIVGATDALVAATNALTDVVQRAVVVG
jgi:hypothetical protein